MSTSVSASRVVPAPPDAIFELLSDPRRHPEIDGSGSVQRALSGPDRLALGSKFGMAMKIGLPYRIRNVVVEHEEGRRIAWRHVGRHRWRYELEPVEGGTRVTETFDWGPVPGPLRFIARAQADRNRRSIEATLDRLVERFSSTGGGS